VLIIQAITILLQTILDKNTDTGAGAVMEAVMGAVMGAVMEAVMEAVVEAVVGAGMKMILVMNLQPVTIVT